MARHAQKFATPELLGVIRAFNSAAAEGRLAWQPSLPLEMAFVEAITPPQEAPAAPQMEAQPARPAAPPPTAAARPMPPPEPAHLPAPVSESALGKRVQENWRQVVHLVKQQKSNVAGLLNSVRSRHLDENILTLGFASDVLKSQMEKPENIEIVQNILKQVIGETIHIRCTTVSAQRSAPPPEVDHDGMVASAVRDLGGEIVDVQ
jgi:DNA polymerase-3 subunit gamma/tau